MNMNIWQVIEGESADWTPGWYYSQAGETYGPFETKTEAMEDMNS